MERACYRPRDERPGHEIVLGIVVQPWKAVTDDEPVLEVRTLPIHRVDTPGYVKVAFNIRVEPYGSGAHPHYDRDTDGGHGPHQSQLFARYWLLVGPFSALIRRLMLRMVKSDAERGPGLVSTTRPPDG